MNDLAADIVKSSEYQKALSHGITISFAEFGIDILNTGISVKYADGDFEDSVTIWVNSDEKIINGKLAWLYESWEQSRQERNRTK